MSYGKVHDVFWDDDKIEELSDRAALLALFLITGPHRNAIGCFRLGKGAIGDLPRFAGWGIEGVSDTLSELVGMGFLVRDDRTGWTFIRNALKHDPINGVKAAIHAVGLAERVPKNTVVYQELTRRLLPQLEPHAEALQGKPGWPIDTPCDTPSKGHGIPNRSPSPLPLPEPEPLPEPFPEPDTRVKPRACRLSVETLPGDWRAWATERGHHDPPLEWEKFRNYWTAKPGKDGVKLDWFATWRNWVINALERGANGHARPNGATTPQARADRAEQRRRETLEAVGLDPDRPGDDGPG